MTIKTIINFSTPVVRWWASPRFAAAVGRFLVIGLRRWLFDRWRGRNRTRLALLELEGEHLSEFGRQTQREMRRELSDRIRNR